MKFEDPLLETDNYKLFMADCLHFYGLIPRRSFFSLPLLVAQPYFMPYGSNDKYSDKDATRWAKRAVDEGLFKNPVRRQFANKWVDGGTSRGLCYDFTNNLIDLAPIFFGCGKETFCLSELEPVQRIKARLDWAWHYNLRELDRPMLSLLLGTGILMDDLVDLVEEARRSVDLKWHWKDPSKSILTYGC